MPLYLMRVSDARMIRLLLYHVQARAVKAVLAGDVLPEGSTDLIALRVCQ